MSDKTVKSNRGSKTTRSSDESKDSLLVTRDSSLSSSSLLLLEVGTEEIPARFLPDAIARLRDNAGRIFSEYRLAADSVKTYATPRRLSLIAEVDTMQRAAEREVWGPPAGAAFDKDGNPTKSAEAFAKTNGISAKDLVKKEKGKGAYVVAVIKEEAQKTEALLPEILPKIILSLNFPKSMRWGDGTLRFARPIHWILATYNNRKAPFALDDTKSSAMTRGHRFLAPAPFEIKDSKAYVALLRNNFVILDPEERKKLITEGIEKLAASVGSAPVKDDELLQHVAFLVEYPVPVLGAFPADYLSLPKELLITVMKSHQKYFAFEDREGRLSNYFAVVSNTKSDNAGAVKRGAEKVIKARFEDARFYYEEDRKVALQDRLENLKKVVYHERLGTVYEKIMRITAIADFIAGRCVPGKKDDAHTAALLSKADLISGVVREFPELQGIMGGYYAMHEGYGAEVSRALAEQYLPGHAGDRLPATDTGTIVSLSDKFDNIASFFMLGLPPTGTEDPFALRRQAIGIISILANRHYDLSITEALEKALQPFRIDNKDSVMSDLVRFFEQRIEPLFSSFGYPADSIAAVTGFVKDRPLHSVKGRIDAIRKIREDADYGPFLLAIKRINNIAPKHETPPVNAGLLAQEEEIALYKEVEAAVPHFNALIGEGKYYDAVKLLMTLRAPINSFFDKVLVMDKDEDIKRNRLALIKSIQALAQQVADFSKLS